MDQYQIQKQQGLKGKAQAVLKKEEQTKSTHHYQHYSSPSSPADYWITMFSNSNQYHFL
jgi:hypothetical protein